VEAGRSPWRKLQLRRATRGVLALTAGLLVLFLALLLVKLLLADPTSLLSTSVAIAAILEGLAAVAAVVLVVGDRRGSAPRPLALRSAQLMERQPVVDRTSEVAELVEKIEREPVVNVFGRRGVGKSFVLEYVVDVVNGNRKPNPDHSWPRTVLGALYFDLADVVGFDEIQRQVCQAAFGEDGNWSRFISYVQGEFRDRPILLVLDNVNSPGVWKAVGKASHQYLRIRTKDRLVLGSIDPLEFHNLQMSRIRMGGLDVTAFGQLAAQEGLHLGSSEVEDLHDQCDGLPYYARRSVALATLSRSRASGQRATLLDGVDLMDGTRDLVAYAALLAVINRQIPVRTLERCPLADFDVHLEDAINQSLLSPIAPDGRHLRMHDIARDDALRALAPEVSDAAASLFESARRRGKDVDAAVFAMFTDPEVVGAGDFDAVLLPVIRSAVGSRNYALLANLHLRSRQSKRILEFLAAEQARYDLFSYGRASQLAGLGRYSDAEEELLTSSIGSARTAPPAGNSALQLEMRFLQADIAHLLNRYEEAAEMFEELADWADSAGEAPLRAKCVWAHAHVLRHQGRDLDRALSLFSEAEALGEQAGALFVKSHSITGASGIRVLRGAILDDEDRRLAQLEEEVAATISHDGHMLGIWKAQARVDWIRGRHAHALETIDAAIDNALALNDRLLYNLYFERGEFRRLSGDAPGSLEDYDRALRFGTGNNDRNLIANALLGQVLADLSAGRWLHHSSEVEARGSALRARQMALEADIQVTAQVAEQVTGMLDGSVGVDPPRLIVF